IPGHGCLTLVKKLRVGEHLIRKEHEIAIPGNCIGLTIDIVSGKWSMLFEVVTLIIEVVFNLLGQRDQVFETAANSSHPLGIVRELRSNDPGSKCVDVHQIPVLTEIGINSVQKHAGRFIEISGEGRNQIRNVIVPQNLPKENWTEGGKAAILGSLESGHEAWIPVRSMNENVVAALHDVRIKSVGYGPPGKRPFDRHCGQTIVDRTVRLPLGADDFCRGQLKPRSEPKRSSSSRGTIHEASSTQAVLLVHLIPFRNAQTYEVLVDECSRLGGCLFLPRIHLARNHAVHI